MRLRLSALAAVFIGCGQGHASDEDARAALALATAVRGAAPVTVVDPAPGVPALTGAAPPAAVYYGPMLQVGGCAGGQCPTPARGRLRR